MNTDAYYERRLPQPTSAPDPGLTEAELLALGDPTVMGASALHPPPTQSTGQRSIVWVRPSDLATTGITPLLERSAPQLARHRPPRLTQEGVGR
ncbi:hypothetical protein FB382_001508 [Nocardioides ginsengisegetis]|uniref:Uncharacterized protein n=1 Tax=Nocardioides ginsengisegetis TaxID=661491 RepID=A0A7W3P9A5_9ACTN|nr:hypothetical protein [Nocardioides ginsengisegetis]MBA8803217.1 hypothetical protein [Nocardioides ginsengisegetis]